MNRIMGKEYVCTLDDVTLKKAKDELNEIPSDRMPAVKALKNWLKQQPHINFPELDDWEYVMFLRGAKFSQLRAREMIEGNAAIRASAPTWFNDIDTHDRKIVSILREGYATPLPGRTKDGCQVLLYRLGSVEADLKRCDLIRATMCASAYISCSEHTQVNGTVFLVDFTGFTAKHMASQMNSSDMKKFNKLWQKNVPGRFKMFHYYNAGLFFEAMMTIAKPFLDKKYIERINTHDNLVSLYKHVPMELLPDEYLPDDYKGPSAGPLATIIDNFIEHIQQAEFRNHLLSRTDSKWGIDETKRPQQDQSSQQLFRKINID